MPDSRPPLSFEDRLLAEAIRVYEETGSVDIDDKAANAKARSADISFEEKIVLRARAHELSSEVTAALGHLHLTGRFIIGLGLVLAFAAGLATAQSALTAPLDQPVNFHWALLTLLGVETLTLLLWIVFAFFGGRTTEVPSLGGMIFGATRRLAGWFHRKSNEAALLQSIAEAYSDRTIVRWTLGAITHGIWVSFLIGALAMALLTLSVKQVVFGWETTILSEAAYLPLTQAIAALPQLAGFPTPNVAEIAASRWEGQGTFNSAASESWAGLLIGSLLLYGLLPRLLVLAFSLFAHRNAQKCFRLDLKRPAYVRLRDVLMPRTLNLGATGPERAPRPAGLPAAPLPAAALSGPFAILGLEIDAGREAWPPEFSGVDSLDLGMADNRKEREQALTQLHSAAPSLVLLAVSLLTTPDRGVANVLMQMKQESDAPVILLLTGGEGLARRYPEPAQLQRIEDWYRLASELLIPVNWIIQVNIAEPAVQGQSELTALLKRGRP